MITKKVKSFCKIVDKLNNLWISGYFGFCFVDNFYKNVG
ncbi:hypothetical protein PEPMIC_00918 [Parvimonas micra ATCC 33270]|uniref:Uncharacterized protein n=1 Tax=Parvimonas micra ATCC 33270 TaxID=411465 RepID=A8SLA2_9FIRM|nr:hypothetical protein PEPMIC_00918 [Parvimonas micra ATCC 33270]